MRVYTSKLTIYFMTVNAAIVLPSVARVCDDQSTVHFDQSDLN